MECGCDGKRKSNKIGIVKEPSDSAEPLRGADKVERKVHRVRRGVKKNSRSPAALFEDFFRVSTYNSRKFNTGVIKTPQRTHRKEGTHALCKPL